MATCLAACSATKEDPAPQNSENDQLYFPPIGTDDWESITPQSLNWEMNQLDALLEYLQANKTRAFLILKEGKIVVEQYWGNNISNTQAFDRNALWYWASAGKTLTAFLVGIAQQEGLLNIQDKSSDYLGQHWTSMGLEKENLITVWHQLTMTTGLDYTVPNLDCTLPECLQYQQDAGSQWYYHNGPYTLLDAVISQASGIPFNQFSDEKVENKIGMSGTWIKSDFNNVYWSTARDAARFGLLVLNKGKWGNEAILQDQAYFEAMTQPSQNLNPSYGYLWWLNGSNAIIYPGFDTPFSFSFSPDAPTDLITAAGKNGQFIDIVPSQNLVIIRMGEAPEGSLVPIPFHNDIWKKIKTMIDGL
ncbi:MAG: serine hydrolase [Microscillaceae bacterium]